MGTGIDLFLDWENGIWVAGKKYNFDPFLVSLVMIFVVNYIIHSTTCKQAYSGAQNSGFSHYACLRMLQMPFPGFKFKNFPCLWHEPPPPVFHKVSATCTHDDLKGLILLINKGFFIDWDFNNSDWDF